MSVVVAYAHPGQVSGPFHQSIVSTLFHDKGVIEDFIDITSGPRIASARNDMVRKFLAHPANPQWMWMLDSDMSFPPDTLSRLLDIADPEDFPIVGGLCFGGRQGDVWPTLYRVVGVNDSGPPIEKILDFPQDALVKVDATGAACLLIHRRVFEALAHVFPEPAPWFAETVIGGLEFGEDITFCLRADRVGFPIHVHTGISIGHMKPRVIGLSDFMAQKDR